jgi:hypothetical protein
MRDVRNAHNILVGKPERKLELPSIYGRIKLKYILNK